MIESMRATWGIWVGACSVLGVALAAEIPTEDRIRYELVGVDIHTIAGPPNPETYRGGLLHQESRNSVTYTLPNTEGGPYEVTWTWDDPPRLLDPRDPFGPPGPLQGRYDLAVRVSFTHGDNPAFIGPTLALAASPCCTEAVALSPHSDPLVIGYWFNRFFLRDDWTLTVRVSDGNAFAGEVVTYRYEKRTVPAIPSTGDCCEDRAGPGCAIASCQSCVCGLAPGCCNTAWGNSCVAFAESECALECACPQPPPEDCCASMDLACDSQSCPGCGFESCHSCVCGIAPHCCTEIWSESCAALASGRDCAEACLCDAGPPQPCCAGKLEPGCAFEACEQCVCDDRPECCNELSVWNAACAERAQGECARECLCADAPPADCCSSNLEVGCAFESCEACVCGPAGNHPECCAEMQLWGDVCAAVANDDCADECLCEPQDTLPKSCCEALDTMCAFEECRSCVEQFRPGCATGVWTEACAQAAIDECADRCFCEKSGTPNCCDAQAAPGCGDDACQACVCDRDGACCSERWTSSCVGIAEGACADRCRCDTVAPPECCAEHDGVGCAFAACEDCVCNDLGLVTCCDDSWGPTCAIAARERCGLQCLCDPGVRTDCCGDPSSMTESAEAGCAMRACELCVCSEADWEHCCSNAWSAACTEQARGRCARICGCERPKADCCDPQSGGGAGDIRGCENEACALCVCAIPGFAGCCTEAWTEECALEAKTFDLDAPCLEVCGCVDLPEPVDCCFGLGDKTTPPGCNNDACARCVCDDPDLFGCCSEEWGQSCSGESTNIDGRCASLCCLGEPSDCCGNGEKNPLIPGCAVDDCARCICDDPNLFDCCTDEWSDKCIGAATTFGGRCADVCGCFEPQDCCRATGNPRPGCARDSCERCVCDDPEFFECCKTAWTARCTARAQSRECAQSCGCSAQSTCCHGPSRFGATTEAPYCFDRSCETCVCGRAGMENCCHGLWTPECAEVGNSIECRRACQCRRTFHLIDTVGSIGDRIRVDDAASFPWFGVVQIGSERLRYYGIEPAENGGGFLVIVERGYEDTPVGEHSGGDEVILLKGVDTAGPGDASCDGTIDPAGSAELAALASAVFRLRTTALCPFADANDDGSATAADFPALLLELRRLD